MLIKTSHNCVISNQATPWLKKNDSQTTICKILLSAKVGNLPLDYKHKKGSLPQASF